MSNVRSSLERAAAIALSAGPRSGRSPAADSSQGADRRDRLRRCFPDTAAPADGCLPGSPAPDDGCFPGGHGDERAGLPR
jgi:hypothetical protein